MSNIPSMPDYNPGIEIPQPKIDLSYLNKFAQTNQIQQPVFNIPAQPIANQMPQYVPPALQANVIPISIPPMSTTLDITAMQPHEIQNMVSVISTKITTIKAEMNSIFYERKEVIDDIWRALISYQHILLLGPPGTAKTFLAKEATSRITGARMFSWQLNRTTDPSDILGPYSIKAMEKDQFRRVLDGKVADCEVFFADECYKANEPVLNILLSILNERVVYNNGKAVPVPLLSMIAASNEVPEEGDGLEALHDRIMLKHWVYNVKDKSNRAKMVQDHINRSSGHNANIIKTTISLDEIKFMHEAMAYVTCDKSLTKAIMAIFTALDHKSIAFSDRKLNWCTDLARANAVINGKMVCTSEDAISLTYALWEEEKDIPEVQEIVFNGISPHKAAILKELKILKTLKGEAEAIAARKFKIKSMKIDDSTPLDIINKEALERYKQAQTAIATLRNTLDTAAREGIDVAEYTAEAIAMRDSIKQIISDINNLALNSSSDSL